MRLFQGHNTYLFWLLGFHPGHFDTSSWFIITKYAYKYLNCQETNWYGAP